MAADSSGDSPRAPLVPALPTRRTRRGGALGVRASDPDPGPYARAHRARGRRRGRAIHARRRGDRRGPGRCAHGPDRRDLPLRSHGLAASGRHPGDSRWRRDRASRGRDEPYLRQRPTRRASPDHDGRPRPDGPHRLRGARTRRHHPIRAGSNSRRDRVDPGGEGRPRARHHHRGARHRHGIRLSDARARHRRLGGEALPARGDEHEDRPQSRGRDRHPRERGLPCPRGDPVGAGASRWFTGAPPTPPTSTASRWTSAASSTLAT